MRHRPCYQVARRGGAVAGILQLKAFRRNGLPTFISAPFPLMTSDDLISVTKTLFHLMTSPSLEEISDKYHENSKSTGLENVKPGGTEGQGG